MRREDSSGRPGSPQLRSSRWRWGSAPIPPSSAWRARYSPTRFPIGDPDQIVSLSERRDGSRDANIPVSGHEYEAWTHQNHVFEGLAVFRGERLNLTGRGEPESIEALRVSANYLPLLRLEPASGRNFAEGEDVAGRNRVAILSDRFWRRRFGADPGVVGRPVRLDDQVYSVVGVLHPLPSSLTPDVWLPIDLP